MTRDTLAAVLTGLALTLLVSTSFAKTSQQEIRHRDTVVRVAKEHRVDPALLLAVVKVESNFDANAQNPDGPVGLTQITPSTARVVQPGIRHADLLHPERNLRVGAKHLRDLLDEFKDPRLALAAYQAGVGRVKAAGRSILQHPHTGNHVAKVMQAYDDYRRQGTPQREVGADASVLRKTGSQTAAGRSSPRADTRPLVARGSNLNRTSPVSKASTPTGKRPQAQQHKRTR